MSIQRTSTMAEFGGRLKRQAGRGQDAINTLSSVRNEFQKLNQAISNSDHLTQTEKDEALAEVSAQASNLVTQIQDFANSL